MKFRVLEGIHFEGNKKYEKGQEVESVQDLVVLFPQKFVLVPESAPVPTTRADEWDEEEGSKPKPGTKDLASSTQGNRTMRSPLVKRGAD